MERGLEQLLLPALIVLAALLDLLVRWAKRKVRKDQPEEVAHVEAETVLLEHEDAATELPEAAPVEVPPEPVAVLVRAPRIQPPPAPRLARQASPSPPPTLPARTRRRKRGRGWLKHPLDARHGIVLMTILGPCRGWQASDRDW